jgi:hypothetical protein
MVMWAARMLSSDGSGSDLEWISADFGYVGCVQIFALRLAGLDIHNTMGLGRILHFARGYPLELRKIDPNKPTSGILIT